jgi:hypothetical protein
MQNNAALPMRICVSTDAGCWYLHFHASCAGLPRQLLEVVAAVDADTDVPWSGFRRGVCVLTCTSVVCHIHDSGTSTARPMPTDGSSLQSRHHVRIFTTILVIS